MKKSANKRAAGKGGISVLLHVERARPALPEHKCWAASHATPNHIRNMKRQILISIIFLAGGLLFPQIMQVQGTSYISNLGQPSTNSAAVGSDSWLAMSFSTGTNAGGYQLNSIQLGMTNASGSPSGFTAMLYSAVVSGEVSPGSSLGTLNGSLNPVTGGIFTYSPASNLTLSPNTPYFIVLTAGTTIANGAYEWSNTRSFPLTYNPSGGWQAPLGLARVDNYQSSNGSSWGVFDRYPEFAINGTAVPEPGVYALLGLGCLCFFGFHYSKRTLKSL